MHSFHLNVDDPSEALSLVRTMQNKAAEHVSVETRLQMAQQNELVSIFEGLARFACMKQCFVKKIISLPARALNTVLSRQQELEFLYLQNVSLSGEQEDFEALAEAFRTHKGLRKIRFYMVRPSLRTNNISLDSIVSAVAAIPTLEEVTLIHSKIFSSEDNDERWDGRSLLDLCRSSNLKVLTLTFATELEDQHIGLMANVLEANNCLRNISIKATNLGREAGVAMGCLLQANSNIEQLRMQLSSDEYAVPIVEALRKNTNLQRLGLVLPRRPDRVGARDHFIVQVTDMLRNSNYNLLQMDLVGLTTNADEIRFWLKVNQVGRKSLLAEGAGRQEWERALFSNCDELSVIFFFLSRNPALCLGILGRIISMSSPPATARKRSVFAEAQQPIKKRCKSSSPDMRT